MIATICQTFGGSAWLENVHFLCYHPLKHMAGAQSYTIKLSFWMLTTKLQYSLSLGLWYNKQGTAINRYLESFHRLAISF
jgi:hypothetical protein